ncbi:hypothetical protein CNYM01_14275 [Colletotrichum nymphaeae SA-01]|uniref:Integral membrane protein n=1 Tax=Colletotrichum nymphaeae SA-01 TaxID=1460502 RepID=A0A135U6J6_9PEZI|nr:hypothetical protein CNYM01_14275 [Colletotrichum nymphaeae SA-01]
MISKIVIALHVVLTLVILAVTIRALQDEANEKKGIVQILAKRFVQVPDLVGSIATAVQSAAAGVVTAAIASGESLVAASLPSSISVGTKYACVASECAAIPGHAFRLIQDLAAFVPSSEEIEQLQKLVEKCPNLETVLFAGLGLVLVSTTLLLAGLKFRLLRFVSLGLDVVAVVLFASDVPDDPPVVVSQQTLEETLARLGISPEKVRSKSRSRGELTALVGCDAAGSTMKNPRDGNRVPDPVSPKTTTAGLRLVIDRINSSIQRLDHQLRVLSDAQERLRKLALLTTEEVDWDDPVTQIRSEEALFDCESESSPYISLED